MKKSIGERIATNLVNLRKTAKLTQLEFAQKVNYSDKAVSKWEKGESLPSVEVLEHICDFYGITFNDLVGDEDIIISDVCHHSAIVGDSGTALSTPLRHSGESRAEDVVDIIIGGK